MMFRVRLPSEMIWRVLVAKVGVECIRLGSRGAPGVSACVGLLSAAVGGRGGLFSWRVRVPRIQTKSNGIGLASSKVLLPRTLV